MECNLPKEFTANCLLKVEIETTQFTVNFDGR